MKLATRVARAVVVGLAIASLLLVGLAVFLRRPSLARTYRLGNGRADAARLERDVHRLTTDFAPRAADDPASLERAAAWIESHFRETGARVESQRFGARGREYRNVVASFGPENGPRVLVGAHYDAMGLFGDNPGADDNASGTAGLLELARLLAPAHLDHRVDLVAFTLEEPPFYRSTSMGSRVYADALVAAKVELCAMTCIEVIGAFTERQPWPSPLLAMVYPTRGDFIGVVGRPLDDGLARRVKGWMRVPGGVPVYSFNGPTMMGTDASDHESFWRRGLPAVMVTDTAFLRNERYHTPRDTADTLDYRRMALVVDGVANAVRRLAAQP
jgi:peptidase M28-like protein